MGAGGVSEIVWSGAVGSMGLAFGAGGGKGDVVLEDVGSQGSSAVGLG